MPSRGTLCVSLCTPTTQTNGASCLYEQQNHPSTPISFNIHLFNIHYANKYKFQHFFTNRNSERYDQHMNVTTNLAEFSRDVTIRVA